MGGEICVISIIIFEAMHVPGHRTILAAVT